MAGSITINNLPCLDPLVLRDEFLRVDPPLPVDNWWGKPNSFRCPLGPESGKSYVLMQKRDALKLKDKEPNVWDAVISDGEEKVTLKGLYLVNALCLAPGWEDEPTAPYLCEFADQRHTLPWLECDKGYNLRDDDGAYLTASLNAGTAWTWAQMIENLWDACVTGQEYPGLPFVPEGTPEGFAYWSTSAWKALNHALTRLACAIKVSLTLALPGGAGDGGQLSIVQLGATDVEQEEAKNTLKEFRVWDDYAIEPQRTNWPKTCTIRFRKIPCPDDGTTQYSTVSVDDTEDLDHRIAGSEIVLDDDLPSLSSNAAARTTRAAERAADYFRKLRKFNRRDRLVYAGIREAAIADMLGAQFAEAAFEDRGAGFKTTVLARPDRWLEEWEAKLACCCSAGGGAGASGTVFKYISTDTLHTLSMFENFGDGGATQSFTETDGSIAAMPFVLPACTLDKLVIDVTTLSTTLGQKCRAGIYKAGTDLLPDELVVDAGEYTIGSADATGPQENSISATILEGVLYWAVIRLHTTGASAATVRGQKLNPAAGDVVFESKSITFGSDRSDLLSTGVSISHGRMGWIVQGLGALAALPSTFPGGGQFIMANGLTDDGLVNCGPPMMWARISG